MNRTDKPMSNSPMGAKILAHVSVARLWDFGLSRYGTVLDLQERLRADRADDRIADTWLAGEHPLVITQGARGKEDDVHPPILADPNAPPAPPGPEIFSIDRGGMTTLHSPGQLILYPIVRVQGGSLAAGRFARTMLKAMAQWIQSQFGVATERKPSSPGLYVQGRKLLSIGISARRGVTMHGISLNLCNDPAPWASIVACGDPATRIITMSEILGREVRPPDQIRSLEDWLLNFWGYASVEPARAPLDLNP